MSKIGKPNCGIIFTLDTIGLQVSEYQGLVKLLIEDILRA
jgi:hypothetical protein